MIIKKKIQKPVEVIEEKPAVIEQEKQVDEDKNPAVIEQEKQVDEDKIDLFNLDNIDFKQRQERRRGDRRRGFRRIDDRNLISRAREEAQTIKEAAAKEGYQAGLEQASNDIADVKNAITAFLSAKQEVFEYIAPDILEISVDIAKKIIKREIQQEPRVILDNILEILKGLSKEETKITLRVNPEQVSLLKAEIPELMSTAGLDAKVLVVPDEELMEGGCMVTTTNGVIDATIETQLSVISEALKEI
ncbi:flagellar assembly protein FliH [Clostridium sp. CAG:967]|nr:flagellar assembly protein FliH [Clostridium sp. CAG:967]